MYYYRFATYDIMLKYEMVLQNYKENDEFFNEAVFTMVYQIIGESKILVQSNIMKTFLMIYEEKYVYQVRLKYYHYSPFMVKISVLM